MKLLNTYLTFGAALFAAIWPAMSHGAEKSAPELFPSSTVVYAEISNPEHLLDVVLDHPLRSRVEQLDAYQEALNQPQFRVVKAVISATEQHLGMSLREAVATLTADGVYAGIDPATNGIAVLAKSGDKEVLEKSVSALLELAKLGAGGDSAKIKSGEYRGITAYDVGEVLFANVESWLIVTNKNELGKQLIDNLLDGAKQPLARKASFQRARKSMPKNTTLWAYVDVAALREAGAAPDLYRDKTDNPGVEVIAGGVLSTAQKTPYATVAVQVEKSHIGVSLAAPHDESWVSPARAHFFAPADQKNAPAQIQAPKNALLTLAAYRDLSHMWLSSGDLFDENVEADLAQADSTLSTFFSGKDFGEDILGALDPHVQFFLVKQQFENDAQQPAIKLPAGALVFRLRDPETARLEFRRTFQSLVGFLNVVGAMNGQPQLDQDIETVGDSQILISEFIFPKDEVSEDGGPLQLNLSPSVAFAGDRMVVSSSKQLARELVDLIDNGKPRTADTSVNTQVDIDVAMVREILNDNRKHLIAQNMLEEGHTREEAEVAIDTILDLVGLVRDASLRLTVGDTLQVDFAVNLAELD